MDALVNAGLVPLPLKPVEEKALNAALCGIVMDLTPFFEELESELEYEDKRLGEAIANIVQYPTLVQLKSKIDQHKSDQNSLIEPPSIEPLKIFVEQRRITIGGLKKLRKSMGKHIQNCQISNTFGNSASIIGGILCFFFPMFGVPVLLAGSATTLGTTITGNIIENRLRKKYVQMLEEDSLAMKICESNLKDITTWLVTVYSLGYSVSKAGVDFVQLANSIQATTTLGTWSQLVSQIPSLSQALTTGVKTASTISGQILGISLLISVADLIQTWLSKNATLEAIDKDIQLLEQQLNELKQILQAYHI